MTAAAASPVPQPSPTTRALPWLASRTNTAVLVCSLVGLAIFTLLSHLGHIPAEPHHNGSILLQPNPLLAIVVAAVAMLAAALLLSVLQGWSDPLDAVLGAAVGLAALSWRSGTMTDLLQNSSPAVFLVLAIELLLLVAGLYGCYALLLRCRRANPIDLRLQSGEIDWNAHLMAVGVAAFIMGVLVMIFAPTDAKKQVMAAVAIAGFVSAAASYSFLENDCPLCYAAAPAIVGIVGYVWAFFAPGAYHIGRTNLPLAYPLPLDYASLGTAASLLGYWAAQRWKSESE